MNKLIFSLLLLLITSNAVSGQITEIEIGMPEAEMLLYINPREYNDGFNLIHKKSGSYIFLNKTNPDFELQIEVQIRGQRVSSIKKNLHWE